MLFPIFEQVNELGETDNNEVLIPQASVEPLLIWDAVIDAVPKLFNCTVIFWVLTTGLTVSATVTTAVPVLTFPLLSVTVSTTLLVPIFEQVNVLGDTESEAIPQASVEPLFTWAPVTVTVPKLFNWAVIFWVTTFGRTVSLTVTIAVAVLKLPLPSVTVKVTVFAPIFEQVNVLGETDKEAIPHVSVEPLFISAPVMVTVPKLFNWAVIFRAIAIGLIVSLTVTTAVPVLLFPFTSTTVKVTVLVPIFEQLNVLGVTDNNEVFTPQASNEPLFICAAVILTEPLDPKKTVLFIVVTVGLIVSITVTVAVLALTFPATSVTVNVTVAFPTFTQRKIFGVTVIVAMPQLSDELLSIWAVVIPTEPLVNR